MKPGFRQAAWTLLFLLALCTNGCGPGVGGTGGGGAITPPQNLGATPAPICGADIATALDCPPPVDGVPAAAGTALVNLADTTPQSHVSAALQGNAIVLDVPCAGQHFSGDWGTTTAFGTRFYGKLTLDLGTEPATLTLQLSGSDLVAQLFDANETSLFGPVLLKRTAAPTTPAACN